MHKKQRSFGVGPTQQGPIRLSVVYGEPIQMRGRTLTPVARVISGGSYAGTVREHGIEGRGWAAQIIRPIKVIEERDGEARTLVIPDITRKALSKMAIVSVAIAVVSIIVILVVRINRAYSA
ncbi:MAG: hypothetical protein JW934_09930 [Anaerolineae bacterium]|nr:hypothetical protein [Anaerolineae bacterium]